MPAVTSTLGVTSNSEVMSKPEVTSTPEVTSKPEVTSTPQVMSKPQVTFKLEVTSKPKVTDVMDVTQSTSDPGSQSPQTNGYEENNNSKDKSPSSKTAENTLLGKMFPLKKKFGGLFEEPKMKNVVFMAMEKDREEKLKTELLPRRQSGPGSFDSSAKTTLAVPEVRARRMSDLGLRRVRKTSSTLNFRRLSLSSAIPEGGELGLPPDPLECLLEVCGTPVTSESRGAYRRFSTILNQDHVTGLCSGFTLGVSAALVLKSAIILLMSLWSFPSG